VGKTDRLLSFPHTIYSVNMRLKIVIVFCIFGLFSTRLPAQDTTLRYIRQLWHDAGKSEVLGDYKTATAKFEDIIIQAQSMTPDIREWYNCVCFFAVARCEAKLSHRGNCRNALVSAFANHFCNYSLVRMDSSLLDCVGRTWYDSVEKEWFNIMSEQSKNWQQLPLVVLLPSHHEEGKRLPLLVWLHGGNGNNRRSASLWSQVPDNLNIAIAFPPGTIRLSDINHSWDTDISVVEKWISPLVDSLVRTGLIDTNEIYVGGFSQGAQAALQLPIVSRWHYRGAVVFSGFLLTPLPSKEQLDEAAKRNVRIYATSGSLDAIEFISSLQLAQDAYRNEGITFQYDVLDDMIHEIPLDFNERFPRIWKWLHESNK
jgi:predicted esterase